MKQPDLGKRIAETRKAKGLTQEELVSKCNLSVRTLQRIEAGVVVPRSYTVKAIATALDCTLNEGPHNLHDKKTGSAYFFQHVYKYVKELFNFKTHVMQKVSILLVTTIAAGFSLFTLLPHCNAQEINPESYVKDNSRGIEMYLPQGLSAYGTFFTNDTLNVRAGDDVIKEYKGKIFLNNEYVGEALQADTLILQKGKLFKKASVTIIPWNRKPTFTGKGIVYITPYPLKTTQTTGEGEVYLTGPHKIREYNNQLFLDGLYEGEAYENDTIILRNKSLTIKKAANKK